MLVVLVVSFVSIKTKNANKERLIAPYIIMLIVFTFFYIYQIGKYPSSLNGDEAGSMLDGINIARYGCDRYLNKWPIYFTNYGDGQNPLFTYIFTGIFKVINSIKMIECQRFL